MIAVAAGRGIGMKSKPQRVALIERGGRSGTLAGTLAAHSVDVVRASGLADVQSSGASCVLVAARPESMAALGVEIEECRALMPLAVFVDAPGPDHLLVTLLEAALRGKREWEGAFDAIVDPVAVLDAAGAVVRLNLGLAALTGRPARELIGLHYAQLLGEGLDPDPIAVSLLDGLARTVETQYGGVPGVWQVTTSPLRGASGELSGLAVLLKDLTQRNQEQERMLQAARLADIGQLAAGVAHEINTPLASIGLRAERLLRAAQDPRLLGIDSFKDFPRYLRVIEEEIFRCKKIIGSLLDFSRSRPAELRATDVNELAQRAVDLVSHHFGLKRIELGLDLDEGLGKPRVDDGQLRQVLLALLMNAHDATEAGGHVRLSTHAEGGGGVRVTVTDDGVGIPREQLDKLFSPFFTTKPPGQGTGLGLAVCHGIVTAHGGKIEVESEVGRGTRVSLILPAGGAQEAGASPGSER